MNDMFSLADRSQDQVLDHTMPHCDDHRIFFFPSLLTCAIHSDLRKLIGTELIFRQSTYPNPGKWGCCHARNNNEARTIKATRPCQQPYSLTPLPTAILTNMLASHGLIA